MGNNESTSKKNFESCENRLKKLEESYKALDSNQKSNMETMRNLEKKTADSDIRIDAQDIAIAGCRQTSNEAITIVAEIRDLLKKSDEDKEKRRESSDRQLICSVLTQINNGYNRPKPDRPHTVGDYAAQETAGCIVY